MAQNGNNGTLGLFIPNALYILADNGTRAVFRLSAQAKPTDVSAQPNIIDTHEVSAQTETYPNCVALATISNDGTIK